MPISATIKCSLCGSGFLSVVVFWRHRCNTICYTGFAIGKPFTCSSSSAVKNSQYISVVLIEV